MTVSPPRLRILHLVLVLRSTNSQYNEHSLPVMHERDITLCTYFRPELEPPPEIRVFAGDDTVRGFFAALRSALEAGGYDAIHSHSPQSGIFLILAMVLRPALRRRAVHTVHDSWYDFKFRNQLLMVPVLAVFARVVFCSHAAFESLPRLLRRIVGRRARIVQNGADIDRIDRVIASVEQGSPAEFTALSIGRLEAVKDPLTVLEAFARGCGERARLVFVGDGELRPVLRDAIVHAGLGDRVTLTGQIEREEVFRHMAEADVFISASHGEGLPVAVMEAMACSLPLVLSDIPPHREFRADPNVVPLVPPGDIDGFARELRRLRALSAGQRAVIGAAGRDLVVSTFSLDAMNAGYEAIYREIGASGGGGSPPTGLDAG